MRIRHLTEEALLEVIAERLPDADRCLAEQHLESCEECSGRLQRLRFAHAVFERLAEVGLNEAAGRGLAPLAKPAPRPHLVWGSAAAAVAACVLGGVLFVHTMPEARASELLSNAIAHEQPQGYGVRIQVGERVCMSASPGKKMVVSRANGCDHALQRISATVWGKGNPLSVRTYASWRSSLKHHKDTVEKKGSQWQIETATDEDAVHLASLEMRATDYHATRLTLDFADDEVVSITESAMPLQGVALDEVARNESQPLEQQAAGLSDGLEVNAWAALHRLNADTGWEATVLRNGSQVRVKALVDGEARRQELARGLSAYPGLALDIHSSASSSGYEDAVYPRRSKPSGDAPGLAESWLETRFTDTDTRMEFSNKVLNLSRHILGRAFFADHLRSRRAAMTEDAYTREMSELLQAEQQELEKMQQELAMTLEPLMGEQPAMHARALSFAEARHLDTVLEDLLLGSSGADEQRMQQRITELRRLL